MKEGLTCGDNNPPLGAVDAGEVKARVRMLEHFEAGVLQSLRLEYWI